MRSWSSLEVWEKDVMLSRVSLLAVAVSVVGWVVTSGVLARVFVGLAGVGFVVALYMGYVGQQEYRRAKAGGEV